ncbi:GNAT family N-acetyltransferase [Sutcliffiella horikoshii]|nr:GNAT family N-acetyltransferase [Sutcliffiella horikoshii]
MEMRVLHKRDAEQYQKLRLESLQKEPASFASSFAEEKTHTLQEIKRKVLENEDSFIYGLFHQSNLVGMIGFQRADKLKFRHKGTIWGVYISEDYRGKGFSKQMLEYTLTRAKKIPGLKQIQLTVAASNTHAKKLYESYGFEVYGYEKAALYVDGLFLDEEHMALHL